MALGFFSFLPVVSRGQGKDSGPCHRKTLTISSLQPASIPASRAAGTSRNGKQATATHRAYTPRRPIWLVKPIGGRLQLRGRCLSNVCAKLPQYPQRFSNL